MPWALDSTLRRSPAVQPRLTRPIAHLEHPAGMDAPGWERARGVKRPETFLRRRELRRPEVLLRSVEPLRSEDDTGDDSRAQEAWYGAATSRTHVTPKRSLSMP